MKLKFPLSSMPSFSCKNIFIKNFEEKHAKELFKVIDYNRDYLRKWCNWVDDTKSPEDSLKFLQYVTKNNLSEHPSALTFGLFKSDEIIGTISFENINETVRQTEIGYWLHKDYQGKGIISWACTQMLNFGFSAIGFEKITIACAVENEKSNNIPKRLGFKYENCEKDAELLHDNYVDHNSYAMLKEEWSSPDIIGHKYEHMDIF